MTLPFGPVGPFQVLVRKKKTIGNSCFVPVSTHKVLTCCQEGSCDAQWWNVTLVRLVKYCGVCLFVFLFFFFFAAFYFTTSQRQILFSLHLCLTAVVTRYFSYHNHSYASSPSGKHLPPDVLLLNLIKEGWCITWNHLKTLLGLPTKSIITKPKKTRLHFGEPSKNVDLLDRRGHWTFTPQTNNILHSDLSCLAGVETS